jgi:hypothetical protein
MATSRENFFTTLQSKLPQAKLIWEKEPDFFFAKKACALTAISIADLSKKFTMNFPEGLGEEPLDDVMEIFIDHFLHALNE